MKACAVICEYNPFHFGHEYQISQLKKDGYSVVCIMSGNFTQRGIPAIVSKYSRAEMAIKGGADLVLELPFPYSSCNADVFCRAGVNIADKLGFIDYLAFGSESGDVESLKRKAEYFLTDEYKAIQNESLSKGGVRLSETYNSEELSSNDILGVGYIKEIITQKSTIQPVAVKRVGMNTNDLEGKGFLSSKSIRSAINNCIKNIESSVPAYVYSILSKEYEKGYYSVMEKLFYSYQSILRMKKSGDILDCAETNEELANRIITAVNKSVTCSELIEDVKTKIYSESKIMRSLLMSTLNIKKDSINVPCFTTLLGMNDTGRQLIKQNKKRICIPIITKQADYKEYGREVSESFEDLIKADSIWNLSLCNIKESGAEIKKSPFVL